MEMIEGPLKSSSLGDTLVLAMAMTKFKNGTATDGDIEFIAQHIVDPELLANFRAKVAEQRGNATK